MSNLPQPASSDQKPDSQPQARPIKRALLSVSDKTGLSDLAGALAKIGVELISTGGTAKALRDEGLHVTDVADVTGFPEIMGGRVKTLHPLIHGGLLGRRDADMDVMDAHNIAPIDLLVVNLYPFEDTVAANAGFEETVENIDIGGPAMIRAAAKNHRDVAVLTDPADYKAFLQDLEDHQGATTFESRQKLAAKAYARTAAYDLAIADWFAAQSDNKTAINKEPDDLPEKLALRAKRQKALRYGENPHQRAALYVTDEKRPGVAMATQIQGKELSYNNLNDTDAAFELVAEFEVPSVAIIKHANPCGVASHETLAEAYRLALRCDPVSAFGGIIALNRPLDEDTAREIIKIFSEVVIAPSVENAALPILAEKKNLRVLTTGDMPDPAADHLAYKTIAGGILVQNTDFGRLAKDDLKIVSEREPTDQEIVDMLFAERVAKHVKSNAIVYAKELATVGIGAGQMSRLDSSRIAAHKAREAAKALGLNETLAKGAVVASDAFFPFPDGLLAAAEAGVTAVIQPGGSVRDEEVIEAANAQGLAMVFTGLRHFRH